MKLYPTSLFLSHSFPMSIINIQPTPKLSKNMQDMLQALVKRQQVAINIRHTYIDFTLKLFVLENSDNRLSNCATIHLIAYRIMFS